MKEIYTVAKNIAIWGMQKGYYSCEDREIIRYGIEVLLSQMITFLPICVYIMFVVDKLSSVCMLLVFASLRVTSEGYHAKSFRSCFLLTNILLFTGIIVFPMVAPVKGIRVLLSSAIMMRMTYEFIFIKCMSKKEKINKILFIFISMICGLGSIICVDNRVLLMMLYGMIVSYVLLTKY